LVVCLILRAASAIFAILPSPPGGTPKNRRLLGRNVCAQIHFENGAVRFSFLKIICVPKIPRPLSRSTFDVVVCLVMLKAPNCDGRHFFVV
jgi:hypothetical protein